VLVVDVGGNHVKCIVTGRRAAIRFKSGPRLSPMNMVKRVKSMTRDWRYDAVSIGYPGVVRNGKIAREPHNLGKGWVEFDFDAAFGCRVKLLNDAAMQALGGYQGSKMLFLGLGTGLGSALIVDGEIVPMELGHLPYAHGKTYEHFVGERGRKRLGHKKWKRKVREVVDGFQKAFQPDYTLLGGGNAVHLKRLPPRTRRGGNADAFKGGFRLWTDPGHAR
jgi:polyphosphate glucokinase